MNEAQREVYEATVAGQMNDYERLIELLLPRVKEEYFRIFPVRQRYLDRYEPVLKKKAYEIARYVLPVATHAYLYHTISALTLLRYHRLVNLFDTPLEQRLLVEKMLREVLRHDPEFEREMEDPYPLEETPECEILRRQESDRSQEKKKFIREFDASLEGHVSKLVDYKINSETTVANAVREVFGLTRS